MRRLLACLAPWMAVTGAWAQSAAGLTVDYTYRGSFLDQGVRSQGVCYVTPAFMRRIGWQVDVTDGVASVDADGRTFQLEANSVDGRRLYCFDEAMRYLGGVLRWDEDAQKAVVLGRVRGVEKTEKGLRIDCTLACRPRVFKATAPDRLIVDLAGTTLDTDKVGNLPSGWRVSQFTPDTVRLVIEGSLVRNQAVPTLAEGRTVAFDFQEAAATPPVTTVATVGRPTAGSDRRDSVAVVIPVTGKASASPSALFLDPLTVQLQIPGSGSDQSGTVTFAESRYVKSADVFDDRGGTTTVTVKLVRPLAFELSTNEVGVSLVLTRPRASGGLAGKVIVVDAGHGGKDNGAVHAGVQEKDMTLAMAKTVARALRDAGASIIMSRSDDTFVSLNERPGMANRSKASLFISCHFNSNSVDGSRSGIIVFYHKSDSMDMLLAECLSHEIAKERLLPDMGTWSDGRIYNSGFAVLRGAEMPAVLMELGFLNHPVDRAKIQTQEFREAVARAVVRGVKEFFGDGK